MTAAGSRARTLALAAGIAALVAAPHAGAATADERAASRAESWLVREGATGAPGQQADAIVALRIAGRRPVALAPRLRALARVAPAYATTAGAAGKVVMAAVAAGGDPRRLGGVDYVGRIGGRFAGGRYGATAFDQALSILALRAAGRPVPPAAVRATLRARGTGGWSFDLSPTGPDSVDVTGLTIEALTAAGVRPASPAIRAAARWMARQADRAGGVASSGGGRPTQANATAAAIRGIRAAGLAPPPRMRAALRALQEADGGVRSTRADAGSRLIATTDALIAFAGGTLPPP